MKQEEYIAHCRDLVRTQDKDRFLLSLQGDQPQRAALWAIYSFNHEIAKTREIVTDTTIGLIRHQWWRDAIGAIYAGGPPPVNAIAYGLCDAIRSFDLPKEAFENLLYAREFDLENVLPSTIEGFFKYAECTNAPLFDLSLRVLGQDAKDNALSSVSKVYGATGILRAFLFHASQHQCYLPSDVLLSHNVTAGQIYTGKADQKDLRSIVETMAAKIEGELEKSGTLPDFLKRAQWMSKTYLRHFESMDYNVFNQRFPRTSALFYLRYLLM